MIDERNTVLGGKDEFYVSKVKTQLYYLNKRRKKKKMRIVRPYLNKRLVKSRLQRVKDNQLFLVRKMELFAQITALQERLESLSEKYIDNLNGRK